MAYKKLKYWFDIELASQLADKISVAYESFDKETFIAHIEKNLDQLELKNRVEKFADVFFVCFNEDYEHGLSALASILGPENEKETGMFTEYYWIMPIAKFVEKYGLKHYSASMHAIEEITKRNTGQYAIRPFIEKHQDKTLKQMLQWSLNENKHIRRLSCEGLRPRLPWAKKLDISGYIEASGITDEKLNQAINDTRKGRTADSASSEDQFDALTFVC